MAGRQDNKAGRGNGKAGNSGTSRGNAGHSCSYGAAKAQSSKMVGLCKDLDSNIFDFGSKTSADLMQTTQEKIVQYVGKEFGGDMANELQNRTPVIIPTPKYPTTAIICHGSREARWHIKRTMVRALQY